MLKALGFGKTKGEPYEPSNGPEIAKLVAEGAELERALIAMDAVLDGQVDQASKLTSMDSKLFTKVATGVLRFIEATVSFEPEAIYAAVEALNDSESSATALKNAAQASGMKTSSYRPGAEYELAEEESGLLGAISMLLTESKKEIVKALFKIRRTYVQLEDLRKHVLTVNAETVGTSGADLGYKSAAEFGDFEQLHTERTQRVQQAAGYTPRQTMDEYVQSGVEAMGGLLHLILSSLPPNIARLLSFVGLSGDRETALEMLWHAASHYENIHGSLALIALIMFFDGQLQYQDILLPEKEENEISDRVEKEESKKASSSPKTTAKLSPRELRETREHLLAALHSKRVYYPHGVLWMLQEGRLVTHVDLPRGVAMLESKECGPNQMRQVEGLLMFDRTMFYLSLDRLHDAATSFINLMEFSSWSHPLYMYMAAACYLELYREIADPKAPEAVRFKEQATKWFLKAPDASGKKVLGRKMPFDGFVVRKVAHFKSVAKTNHIDLADAIATSPLYEALYFWNGQSRMLPDVADRALKRLTYSAPDAPHPPAIKRVPESSDEQFTRELLQATYARKSPNSSSGYELLKKLTSQVVSGNVDGTNTHNKKVVYHARGEPWAGPGCLYERAIYEWLEHGSSHAKQVRRWLDLSADWPDDYELSTRINMKVTSARDRLDIYRL